jgi:hypothetical protein
MLSVGGAKYRFAGVELRLQSHSLLNELIHLSAAPALRQGNNLKSVVQLRILHGEDSGCSKVERAFSIRSWKSFQPSAVTVFAKPLPRAFQAWRT